MAPKIDVSQIQSYEDLLKKFEEVNADEEDGRISLYESFDDVEAYDIDSNRSVEMWELMTQVNRSRTKLKSPLLFDKSRIEEIKKYHRFDPFGKDSPSGSPEFRYKMKMFLVDRNVSPTDADKMFQAIDQKNMSALDQKAAYFALPRIAAISHAGGLLADSTTSLLIELIQKFQPGSGKTLDEFLGVQGMGIEEEITYSRVFNFLQRISGIVDIADEKYDGFARSVLPALSPRTFSHYKTKALYRAQVKRDISGFPALNQGARGLVARNLDESSTFNILMQAIHKTGSSFEEVCRNIGPAATALMIKDGSEENMVALLLRIMDEFKEESGFVITSLPSVLMVEDDIEGALSLARGILTVRPQLGAEATFCELTLVWLGLPKEQARTLTTHLHARTVLSHLQTPSRVSASAIMMFRLGFSPTQIETMFSAVGKGARSKSEEILNDLPGVSKFLLDENFTHSEVVDLFGVVVMNAGDNSKGAFREVINPVRRLRGMKVNNESAINFLGVISKNTDEATERAYSKLVVSFTVIENYKIDVSLGLSFLEDLSKNCGDKTGLAFEYLNYAMVALQKHNINKDQRLEFLKDLSKNCGNKTDEMFRNLDSVLSVLDKHKINKPRQLQFLKKLSENCGGDTSNAMAHLDDALESLITGELDKEGAIRFIEQLSRKTQAKTGEVLEKIPALVEHFSNLGYRMEQITDYINRVVEQDGEKTSVKKRNGYYTDPYADPPVRRRKTQKKVKKDWSSPY
jgi:polyhydroxyalkanoate synthesis regulator phasin